ncbi:TOPRS ligase, partial [Anhinga rufa]|nr:TOPRS ligase [Anhinga rufa]
MASERGDRCPVCLDSWDDAAYVMPCLHQFCCPCILRWAESKPECPLCKRRVQSIVHSVRADNDFKEVVIRAAGLASASAGTRQAGGAPGHPANHSPPRPVTPRPLAVDSAPRPPVGGLQPDAWASLFDDHPALLRRFLPWLQQQLGLIFFEEPSTAAVLEDLILCVLGLFGLDEEVLVRLLQESLQNHAATFVRQLINVAMQRCSREAHRLLGLEDGRAAEEQEGSPTAAPRPAASQRGYPAPGPASSTSPPQDHQEERPSTSAAVLRGCTSSPLHAPIPTHGEQEEQQEDQGEAVAGPSTPSQQRHHTRGRPRRPLKRRAQGSSRDSSQPSKRPPHRQH